MLDVQAISLAFTYNTPEFGSRADPPHSAPPSNPGKSTVALPTMNGTNCPSLRNDLNCSSAHWCACGVRVVNISAVNNCRAYGAGFNENGCIVAATSPSTVLGGPRRYSIGKSGAPLARSNRNTKPCLVVCATASMLCPSRLTVTSVGGDGKSRSQISCFTP